MRISDWSSDVCSSDLFRLLPCLWPRADHAACRALHYGPHAGVPAAPVPETETGPEGPVGPYPCGPASVALCHAQDLRRDEHQQLGLFIGAALALEQVAQERDVAEERDI